MDFENQNMDGSSEVFHALSAIERIKEYILVNLSKDLSIGTVSGKA